MTSRFYGLPGLMLAAALLGSCKEDPTASLAGGIGGVQIQFSERRVAVDDSALISVRVLDALGRPLAGGVTLTSCNAVTSVIPTPTPSGLVESRFFVKAVSFGSGCVRAVAGSYSDSMGVTAVPGALVVAGPSTLVSGAVQTYTATFRSATNRDITAQFPAVAWSVDSTRFGGIVAVAGAGSLTVRDFGVVNVIATGSGTTGTRGVTVTPAAFVGTFTPEPAAPTGRVRINRGAGPAFDGDEIVYLNRVAIGGLTSTAFERVVSATADSVVFQLDDLRAAGTYEVVLNRVGATQQSIGGDSLTVTLPALVAAITPAPVDVGGTIRITPGAGPLFDADTRVYINDVLATQASNTPDSIKINIADLSAPGTRTIQLTRIGASQASQRGSFVVAQPATFAGTVAPSASGAAERIAIARGPADPAFDSDVRVYFDGVSAILPRLTADTVYAIVPALGSAGVKDLLIVKIGSGQLARLGNFASSTFLYDDPYDATNADPTTAPAITADGDYFVVLHGQCRNGVGGTECDDFFTIANPLAVTDSVTVVVDWATNADVDVLWCNAGCSAFVGNFAGATAANPETTRVRLPATTTWRLWLNLWDAGTVNASLIRVRVTGLGVAP